MADMIDEGARTSSLRVLTLNVWARHGDWPSRRAALATGLRQADADLMCFQETVVTGDDDQVQELIGPGYHVIHHGGREADGTGLSVASRWPLRILLEEALLVTPRVDPRELAARVAVLEVAAPAPFGPLLLVHHKPTFRLGYEYERELQAVAAARLVAGLATDRPVIVAGDFDDVPESASIRFWRGLQSLDRMSVRYLDAWEVHHRDEPGHTFTPRNPLVLGGNWPLLPPRRIDYIMVGCGDTGPHLRIAGCRLAFDEPIDRTWASDHFGVVADLASPDDRHR
jgi:endonuclease/exonuclease/phosphatase family metal-dependent hydrolase